MITLPDTKANQIRRHGQSIQSLGNSSATIAKKLTHQTMTILSLAQLQRTYRTPPLPATITLSDSCSLHIDSWLRVLPGKRYVAKARRGEQVVLAKLFVGPRSEQKLHREIAGNQQLNNAAIATPSIIEHGNNPQGAWLLTEFLNGAEDLYNITGRDQTMLDQSLAGIEHGLAVAKQVAELHNAHLAQADGHPGNFMFIDSRCYVIDCADIIPATTLASHTDNVGQLLAQLPQSWWPALWQSYQQTAAHSTIYNEVYNAALKKLAWRGQNVAEKSVRDCTQFAVSRHFDRFEVVIRDKEDQLAPLFKDLDTAIANGQPLKKGGSATVAKVEWQGQTLVIKRYNLKNWLHRISRWFRPTRAWHSWQGGNRLRTLGIATPKPLAMVEERFGPLRGRGYLITECSSGLGLVKALEQSNNDTLASLTGELQFLLQRFREHKISHGDFKATNLLWDSQRSPSLSLIDLDVIRWHNNPSRWRKHYRKDVRRLLRNWRDTPAVLTVLEPALLTDTDN